MNHLKIILKEKTYLLLLSISLFICASCETKGQDTAENKAPKMSIHEAVFMGNVDAVKAHIKAKTDLDQKDAYGSGPLTIAAIFNKPEVARLLIDGGANINMQSGDGSTPLHSAAFFCRKDIAKMLLEKGADVNIRNNYGSTALESVSAPFPDVKPIYDQLSRDLGPLGLKLDYDHLKATRPVIAEMIKAAE